MTITPRLSFPRGGHLVFPQPRFEQVRSQDGFWLQEKVSSPQALTQQTIDPGSQPRWKNTKEKTRRPSLTLSPHTLRPSPSVSLSLDDCINTGKAHSTDAHTHTYIQTPIHSLACLLTHSHIHTLTSTVLCGQAGG